VSGTTSTQITAVVVTYQSAGLLRACLEALAAEAHTVDEFELVIVDNDSSDGTEAVATAAWPRACFVQMGRNAGYAAAINEGLGQRRGSGAVLVLNPDVRLRPGCLRALLTALRPPGVGIAAPRIVDVDGRTSRSLRREPTVLRALGPALLGPLSSRFAPLSECVIDPDAYERRGGAAWATGAVLLMSAECVSAVGPWDESFFLYSEETEVCLRARDLGFSLAYEPSAVAEHLGGESRTDPDLWSILTVNRVRLARRRLGRLRGAAFGGAVVVNEALRACAGRETSRAALRALLVPASRPPVLLEAQARAAAVTLADLPVPIICFSAQDFWYHNRAHSDVQLMRRLAGSRKVLLINSIGLRLPLPGRSTKPLRRIARKLASTSKWLRRPYSDLEGFAVLSPVVLPLYGSPLGRSLNGRLVAAQVRWACRRLGISAPTAVVTIPSAVDVLPFLELRGVVFNRSDKHSEFDETDQAAVRAMEERLLQDSDAVVYVSRQLMHDDAAHTDGRASFLDHGVDLGHFWPAGSPGHEGDEPEELRLLPHPRVGFFGGIDDYVVDTALLERVARELDHVQLVLVGDVTCPIDELLGLPNVTWVPRRPYELIPAFGRSFDVALMPWLRNEWVRCCNPIKLKEYLALGLPVVSVDFPEVQHYADVIRVARDSTDFVDLVRRTLEDGGPASPADRRAAVLGSSWDAVASRLAGTCDAVNGG
jgi:GT2 family glycosyltransferase/glycosyltransferase involved in cell wall biosynthesis